MMNRDDVKARLEVAHARLEQLKGDESRAAQFERVMHENDVRLLTEILDYQRPIEKKKTYTVDELEKEVRIMLREGRSARGIGAALEEMGYKFGGIITRPGLAGGRTAELLSPTGEIVSIKLDML